MDLGCLWEGSTKILAPPPHPLPPLPPPPPCGCCHTIYLSIYPSIYLYTHIDSYKKKFVYAQTLSLFTPQTLHPDILRKQKPQTWHHVFLPTYGRAEADDAQRLKLLRFPTIHSKFSSSHEGPQTLNPEPSIPS